MRRTHEEALSLDIPKVIIATPTRGSPSTAEVCHGHVMSVRELEKNGFVHQYFFASDICRARSRAAHEALKKPDWEWMLWLDDDVVFDSKVVWIMLAIAKVDGHRFMAAPYPRKRLPIQFPYKPMQADLDAGKMPVNRSFLEVELAAAGFWLTHRSVIEDMTVRYRDELWFSHGNQDFTAFERVACLFDTMYGPVQENRLKDGEPYREYYSEDYSFCYRWRAMGGKIHLYVGEGAPLGHVGRYEFRGGYEDLGTFK